MFFKMCLNYNCHSRRVLILIATVTSLSRFVSIYPTLMTKLCLVDHNYETRDHTYMTSFILKDDIYMLSFECFV